MNCAFVNAQTAKRIWPRCWPDLATFGKMYGPSAARHVRPRSGRYGPDVAQPEPHLAQIPNCKHGQTWAMSGKHEGGYGTPYMGQIGPIAGPGLEHLAKHGMPDLSQVYGTCGAQTVPQHDVSLLTRVLSYESVPTLSSILTLLPSEHM